VLPLVTATLLRIPAPFDHPDFVYEIKYDGFRDAAIPRDELHGGDLAEQLWR
jgi:ATP-dependent DNA ligase